ncbi:unnamed protein product [Diatraea saccharalis]|uniref:E3 ubiquitin-protein ligase n=1 Tax=Diatraea saccharalis TaxID=40085 RepID=A0A9N9WBA7_9NEOP|nr:unnamed protein product [Diatraea saccharalis]
MASAKANKKVASAAVDLPECPVCLETMMAPIYQCSGGHSLCHNCTKILCPPICPICRQQMTQMRNWQLEEIVQKAKVPCPNKSAGCVYIMVTVDVEDHLKECIFREMDCPLGAVFGKCSWSGRLNDMMDHFKERHPTNCNISSDTDVELNNVNINMDERLVYLVTQGKIHFIITMKIDTLQKMAYWAIQLIGGKKTAQQHIYEIHVNSKQDNRKKVVFIEHCFNDAIKADEVFRQNQCAVLPLESLKHFINNKKLSFRFFIKRIPQANKDKKGDWKKENNTNKDGANEKFTGPPRGPGPNSGTQQGPKGAGVKGPWPKGPGAKGPGPKKQHKAHA